MTTETKKIDPNVLHEEIVGTLEGVSDELGEQAKKLLTLRDLFPTDDPDYTKVNGYASALLVSVTTPLEALIEKMNGDDEDADTEAVVSMTKDKWRALVKAAKLAVETRSETLGEDSDLALEAAGDLETALS